MQTPVKIFVVYAHEDKVVRDKLIRQLRPLAEKGEIALWSDDEIKPGALWEDEIRLRLTQSEIILLLISDDFFASDYIRRVELETALDLYARGETRLVPVVVRHCGWADMPTLSRLQALPPEGRPVLSKEWDSPDEPYLKIYEGLKAAVRELRRKAVNQTPAQEKRRSSAKIFRNWRQLAFAAVLVLAAAAGVWKFVFSPMDTKNATTSQVSHRPDSIFSKAAKPDTAAADKKNNPPAEVIKDKPAKSDGTTASSKTKASNKPLTDNTKAPGTQLLPKTESEKIKFDHQLAPVEGMSRVIKDRKQGFLNIATGQVIGWYEDAENFYKGRAYVKQNGRYFRIDKTGRCVEGCE